MVKEDSVMRPMNAVTNDFQVDHFVKSVRTVNEAISLRLVLICRRHTSDIRRHGLGQRCDICEHFIADT